MVEWHEKLFGECATLIRETVLPSSLPDTPYIGLEHIGENTLSLSGHGVSSDVESMKTKFSRGDILFGKLRPYFRKIIRAPFDGICSTDIWVVQASKGIEQGFLYYCMASQLFVDFVDSGSEGTRMPRAKWEFASQFELSIPLPTEQRAIAHVLGTLDDKIELNRRMNETLEATARALFKSWFVDFDPVRARMEGRDTGLPEHVADLFPDRMMESELGEIPEGWGVKALEECFNLKMGQSPPGSTYNEHGEGLPFFQGRTDFGFRYPENRKFCTAPTRVAQPGDTLVSVRAPVGDINMAWERCCIGRGVAALRHKSGSKSFSYYFTWMIQEELREYEQTGTVFGAINKGQFEALRMIEPKPNVVDAFDSYASPLDMRIRANIVESRALVALRDTLLPMLMSGELRTGEISVPIPYLIQQTDPEPRCALCETPLNDGNDSKEHVILNAIGGRKTVRNFICKKCNSRTGEKWDKALADQLQALCTMLDIKRRRGDNQPVPVETVGGEPLLLRPDGSMTRLKPTFSERNIGNAMEITIQAGSIQDVKKMLPGLKRKYPNLDVEEILKQAISQQQYLQEPLYIPFEFGGNLAGRSIVKSCLALAYEAGLGIDDCEHAKKYLLEDGEPCFGYYNETDVVRNRPPKVFFHCIFVCGNPESGQILAYAEYFGFQRIVACLSSSYDGPRFSRCYAIDPLTGNELDLDVQLDFTPEDITAIYAYEKVNSDNTQMALESLLETWKEKDTQASIFHAIDDAATFAFTNCGAQLGERLSEEHKKKIARLFWERLEPFIHHLPSSWTFSEDEIRKIELKMRKPDQDAKDEGG